MLLLHLTSKSAEPLRPFLSASCSRLHEACYLGNPEVCEVLLSVKANVDALSKNGSTPLLVAAREGHNAICESLLKHNADADDGGDKGWTPLSVAAGEGHVAVCETLLKYNANVHGFAADGRFERSALQEAISD